MNVKECRKLIKNRLKAVSCITENDEEYEQVISWHHHGYLMGNDLDYIQWHTLMRINSIYIKPTGVAEIMWVRKKQ